jgi:glycosyltransferase involved in cell wall biosynthesis
VHAVAAGDGPDRARILELAEAAGVRQRFHLIGFRRDVSALLRCLDVFVICSDYEGLVNVMLEALMAGVPVISTPVNGAESALADGAGIVAGWSAAEIASAIETVRVDPALRARMGRTAAEVAQQRYSITRMVDDWEALLVATGNKKADRI